MSAKRNRKWILFAICLSIGLLCALGIKGMLSKRAIPHGLEDKAKNALEYAHRHGMSEQYCLLLDYSIPSGYPRLFVWSFEKGDVIYRAHVMHGPGKGSTKESPVFSNEFGSESSSIGRFSITKQHGKVNKNGFYLKGLDVTNSNAYRRGLMIHGSYWVSFNTWRRYIPLNRRSCQGCVATSNRNMTYLSKLIEEENRSLLLWSFCSEQ